MNLVQLIVRRQWTFDELLQALPHDMDVLNIVELVVSIGVVASCLVSLPCCTVCHSIDLERR